MDELHSAAEALHNKKAAAALQHAAQLNSLTDVASCEHHLLTQLLALLSGTTARVETLEASLASTASELRDERIRRQADLERLGGQLNQLQTSLQALELNHANAISQLEARIISVTERFEKSEEARHMKEVEAARERNEAAARAKLIEEAEQQTLVQIHRCPTGDTQHRTILLDENTTTSCSNDDDDSDSQLVFARSSSLTINGEMVWLRFPNSIALKGNEHCIVDDRSHHFVVAPGNTQGFRVTPPPSESVIRTFRVTVKIHLFDGSVCDVALRGNATVGPSCKIARNGLVVLVRYSNGRRISRDLTPQHFTARQSDGSCEPTGNDRSWQSNAADIALEFEVSLGGRWSLDVTTFPNSRIEDLPLPTSAIIDRHGRGDANAALFDSLSTVVIVNESLNSPVVIVAPGPLVITTIPHRVVSSSGDALSLPGIPGIACTVQPAKGLSTPRQALASNILRQCPLNCEVYFLHALVEPATADITLALVLPAGVETLISCRGESAPFAVGAALIMCQFDDRRELVIGELRSTLMVGAGEQCTLRLRVDGARRTFSVSFVEKGIRLVDLPFDSMSSFTSLYRLLLISRKFM